MGVTSQDLNEVRSPSNGLVPYVMRMVGTGASAPTVVEGKGFSSAITRTSAGLYKLTLLDDPGTFLGATPMLQAATPADIDGHSVVADTYDSTNKTIEVLLSDPTPAAHDLAASEWLTVILWFRTGALA